VHVFCSLPPEGGTPNGAVSGFTPIAAGGDNDVEMDGGPVKDGDMDSRGQPALPPESKLVSMLRIRLCIADGKQTEMVGQYDNIKNPFMKLTKRILLSLVTLLLVTDSAFCGDETNYFNSGNVKAHKGDLDGAIADYTKAIKFKPDYAKAYNNRGLAKNYKGDLDGALADYNKAIKLNPDVAPMYFNRANTKKDKNDLNGAIIDYTKAIELQPDYAAAYDNRGILKKVQGDLNGAIADYNKAIKLNPQLYNAYNNRGLAKAEKGDLDGALADYNKAIELNPEFAEAYYNRGRENQTKRDLDNALADFNKAVELDPKFADPYANRGIVKRAKGDLDGSIADFAIAIELNPKMQTMLEAKGYSTEGQSLKDDPQREAMSGQNLNTNEVIDLETAVAKNPDNLSARTKLLGYYFNSTAAKSLEEYEKAQSTDTSELSRFHRLDALAKSAFAAREINKASQYANELLEAAQKYPKDWNYGNAIHHGNNVLGCVALKQGDVKQADEYLLKAGQTPGSPTLDSFGPNMSLAKELLEKGEKETVLQYFELCRKFWGMGGENLDNWTKEVNAGKVPHFGANLIY
jgi:tetratricopeptide (TPR) repeat protein